MTRRQVMESAAAVLCSRPVRAHSSTMRVNVFRPEYPHHAMKEGAGGICQLLAEIIGSTKRIDLLAGAAFRRSGEGAANAICDLGGDVRAMLD